MTRTRPTGGPAAADLLTTPVRLDRAAPPRVVLRWEIAAAALHDPMPGPGRRTAPRSGSVYLEWSLPLGAAEAAEARAELIDPATGRRETLAVVAPSRDDLAGPVRCSGDGDLHHTEIDGLLSATLRVHQAHHGTPGPSAHVLYARTTLLARLGVPGGRYELIGASVLA